MRIFNHNNNEITIPQHISIWGVISAYTFIITSIVSYSKDLKFLSIHFLMLYLTTISHWIYPKKKGFIRNLDIFTVVTLKIHGTYESLFLDNHYKYLWFSTFLLSASMFFFNEFLYYHQITKYNKLNNNKIITIHFFSLIPTRPNTKEREYAYKRSTLTHIIFIHIIPQLSALYCILNNNR
jgi:hypothetical protein